MQHEGEEEGKNKCVFGEILDFRVHMHMLNFQ